MPSFPDSAAKTTFLSPLHRELFVGTESNGYSAFLQYAANFPRQRQALKPELPLKEGRSQVYVGTDVLLMTGHVARFYTSVPSSGGCGEA